MDGASWFPSGREGWLRKLLVRVVALILVASAVFAAGEAEGTNGEHGQGVPDTASALWEAGQLMAEDGIVGTGLGLDERGMSTVVVLIESFASATKVPAAVQGLSTETLIVGELTALPCPGGSRSDCSDPIPGGVSVGHPLITAGTLGAYVRDAGGNYFALSNNHVFAAENRANVGDTILQPGPADGGMMTNPSHVLGTLSLFEPITFCSSVLGCSVASTNEMDAALTAVDAQTVRSETICGWAPSPTPLPESAVVPGSTTFKKCGRTTGATSGRVLAVNVTVDVQMSNGRVARFDGQILTEAMSAGGDSGSLMVDTQNRPTALLFAGSTSATVGTPIEDVLDRFDVAIVDSDPSGPPPPPSNENPAASFTVSCTDLVCAFDASASNDPDGTIVSYRWDFGDNSTGSGKTTSHTYASSGNRTVTLTVTDDDDATDTTTRTADPTTPPPPPPSNEDPAASFTVSCTDLVCAFDASASNDPDGTIVSYRWDFGDNSTGSGKTTSHTYASSGNRTVTLTVTDDDDATDTTTRTADPTTPPPPPPSNEDPAASFTDMAGSPFASDIEWLAGEGITKGCNPPANDRFCPHSSMTRGQMAAFLVRALNLPAAPSAGFVDTLGTTFEKDIDRLAAAGITKGCNPPANDRFCPDDKVRREVMAAFLVRALGYTDDRGGDLFADDDSSIFESDIDKLATAGVTKGCNPPTNDQYCPKENVTRGQMAAFLRRALS